MNMEKEIQNAIKNTGKRRMRKNIRLFFIFLSILIFSSLLLNKSLKLISRDINVNKLLPNKEERYENIRLEDKMFLVCYSIYLKEDEIIDNLKLKKIIENQKLFIKEDVENSIYIAIDTGIKGQKKAEKIISDLKKIKIIKNAEVITPIFNVERE